MFPFFPLCNVCLTEVRRESESVVSILPQSRAPHIVTRVTIKLLVGAQKKRMDSLSKAETRAVLLLIRYFRFVVSWFGWRKWLRAVGLLDHAYGIEGMLCGNETARSIARAREYVFKLEEEWLRENTVELLTDRRYVACLYDNDVTFVVESNEAPSIQVSPVLRAAIRSLLADLSDLSERRRFVAGRVLVNVQQRAELYSYDYTLCTFLDETVDLMFRSLELCYTERNQFATLYETSERLPNGGSLFTLNVKLLIPLQVQHGRHVLIDPNESSYSRFMTNFRSLLFDTIAPDEQQLTHANPEARKFAVLATKNNLPIDVALGSSFAHNLIGRSDIRSLLRVNYESLDAKSILVSAVLNAGRAGSPNATVDTLVRAMRVGTVAIYRLVYMYRPSSNASAAVAAGANLTEGKELRDIHRTFERMAGRANGAPSGNWFPLNGFERATALSLAVFKLLFERDVRAVDQTCDVNRQTLMSAGWYASYAELGRDIVQQGSSDRANSVAVQGGLIFLATSVLIDVDTVFAELRSRGSCVEVLLSGPRGLYLRHQRYDEMALLLLPAECSPIYSGSLELVTLPCTGDGPHATLTRNSGKKFRLCLLFPERKIDDYRSAATQLGLATLVADLVEHFFPKSLDVIGSGDATNRAQQPPDAPNVQNSVQARVRALLAKMLSFDPFQAKGLSEGESRYVGQIGRIDRLASEKYLVCSSKLWQVLRQMEDNGARCRAYVRRSSTLYSPFRVDRLITQTYAGLRPVCTLDQNDTWKMYSYQYTRSSRKRMATASLNRFVDCRAYLLAGGPDAVDVLSESSCSPASFRPVRKYVDLFDEADHLIAAIDEKASSPPSSDERACPKSTTCSALFTRAGSGPNVTGASVDLLCVQDRLTDNWCIYRFGERQKFDEYVRTYESVTGVNLRRDSVRVYLLGWYIDNYNFSDANAPTVIKVISKRVYLVNGYLAFCETPTKIVSVEPERIAKARNFVAVRRNFANYNIDQRDEICFSREVTATDNAATVQLPADHFYNRVFRPMCERNVNREGTTLSCTMTQVTQYYYVVRLHDCRFWFPTVRLLNAAASSPDGTVCYGSAPSHIVPLLAQSVLEAAKTQ